jgi:hypothetical protein
MDPASIITAVAALVAACGGIVAAILAYHARVKAEEARQKAAQAVGELIVIEGEVRKVGEAIDGRLTTLLATTQALARAEGIAQGEQAQRDRSSESQV